MSKACRVLQASLASGCFHTVSSAVMPGALFVEALACKATVLNDESALPVSAHSASSMHHCHLQADAAPALEPV